MSRILVTLFSQTAEFVQRNEGNDVEPTYISRSLIVNLGFSMLLVCDMIECAGSKIRVLDLTPADDKARWLFRKKIRKCSKYGDVGSGKTEVSGLR